MRLKRKIAAVLAALAVVAAPLAATVGTSSSAEAASGAPIIWLVPHQDDEVLSYGADIRLHAKVNTRPLWVVLLTDGSHSGVCDVNNDGVKSTAEQLDCTIQRDAEFNASVDAMGANTANPPVAIIRPDRAVDGNLTIGYVKSVIEEYRTANPGATFKGMSHYESVRCSACSLATHPDYKGPGPGHPDHDAIGEGLAQMENQGKIANTIFYLKADLWHIWPNKGNTVRQNVNDALDAYGVNAPDSPATITPGIGHRSTDSFCEQYGGVRSEPTSLHGGKSCDGWTDGYGGQGWITTGGADSRTHLRNG